MFSINEDVVFVKGAVNGAIYNFKTGRVFAINHVACSIIDEYIANNIQITSNEYLELLCSNDLISHSYKPSFYSINANNPILLDMAWIEITQQCNLKCLHCYEGDVHRNTDTSLSTDKWIDVIDELASLHINRLIIIGGEPCCYPQLGHIIKHAAKYPFQTTLFTNATLLSNAI